jgi:hypothetical protein
MFIRSITAFIQAAVMHCIVGVAEGPYERVIEVTATSSPLQTSKTVLSEQRQADLTVFDGADHGHHWQSAAMTIEVVASEGQDTTSADSSRQNLQAVLGEIGDCVRLRMSSRPHQIFTLSILLCGQDFYVMLWDRQGVTVSKRYHIERDLDIFIRLVIQVTRRMDLKQLGLDDTIDMEPQQDSQYPIAVGPDWQTCSFYVTFGQHRLRLTESIFQSVSLLGRGTQVFAVQSLDGQDMGVVKSAWRSPVRASELENYRLVQKEWKAKHNDVPLHGVARLLDGTDAGSGAEANSNADAVTTKRIRAGLRSAPADGSKDHLALHRIWLADEGKPLWQYATPLELLLGVRDAVRGMPPFHVPRRQSLIGYAGLQRLADLGYLHRDISAGNMLLAKKFSPDIKAENHGFVSDLEFLKRVDAGPTGLSEFSVSRSELCDPAWH